MKKYIIGLLLVMLVLEVACTPTKVIPENKLCAVDTDCVPADCCHAKDSVNLNSAPNCEGMMCTMECAPNTLDCGQGEVKCVEKECKAVMKN